MTETDPSPMTVLHLEDDAAFRELVRHGFRSSVGDFAEVVSADTVAEAERQLAENSFDCILIDLNLHDAWGLTAFRRVRDAAGNSSLVVLTGDGSDDVGLACLRAGADEFLSKSDVNGTSLVRAVRFAIERNASRAGLARPSIALHLQKVHEDLVGRMGSGGPVSVTSRMLGERPLRDASPATFENHVTRFGNAIDIHLDERVYAVDHSMPARLREIALELSVIMAGPRDLVELYDAAVQRRTESVQPETQDALREAGRLILLEVMGHLVSAYRARAMPVTRRAEEPS